MQASWIRLTVAFVMAFTALVSASGPGGVDAWAKSEPKAQQTVTIEMIDSERKIVCAAEDHVGCEIDNCCVACGVIANCFALGEHETAGPARPRRPRAFVSIAATPPIRPPRQRQL